VERLVSKLDRDHVTVEFTITKQQNNMEKKQMSDPILFENVAVGAIQVPEHKLREARVETLEFELLQEDIKNNGIEQNLTISPDPGKPGMFILVNGLQRFTAATNLGFTHVPCFIKTMDELKRLATSIRTNVHTVQTRPVEFGKAIRRMLELDPTITVPSIAAELGVRNEFILARMSLDKIEDELSDAVDSGIIGIQNAIKLSKLPQNEQAQYSERAATMPAADFAQIVDARLAEIKQALRTGTPAPEPTFSATARSRTRAELLEELQTHTARATNVTEDMSALDAFDAALNWALSLDADTVAIARDKWEAQRAAAQAKKEAAAAARAAKKATEGGAADAALAAATA